uniref:Uncharacterized protein n=1 Tax=Rhizophora mucronata TaxID=61149 RepID=A0A2P2QMK0_RHIMU
MRSFGIHNHSLVLYCFSDITKVIQSCIVGPVELICCLIVSCRR